MARKSVSIRWGGVGAGLVFGAVMFAGLRNSESPAASRELIGAVIWVVLGAANLYRLFTLAAYPERFAHASHERAREAAKLCVGAMGAIGLLAPQPVKLAVVGAMVCLMLAIWLRVPARLFGEPT